MTARERVKEFLEQNKIPYVALEHQATFTAQGTAESLHVPGKQVAKAVVLKGDGRFLMAVLEAPDHVDLRSLKEVAQQQRLSFASEIEMQTLLPECEIGAVPPFGPLYDMPVYMDEKLEEDRDIVCNAGTHEEAIRLKLDDFKRLVHPTVCSIARDKLLET